VETTDVLIAVEGIKRLKARYCRLVDTKQWADLRQLLTDDATMEIINPTGEIRAEGGDKVIGLMSGATAITVHQVHAPEIEILGPSSARGVWAVESVGFADASAKAPFMQSYGHYHETYTIVDGEWRIATIRLTRLHVASK